MSLVSGYDKDHRWSFSGHILSNCWLILIVFIIFDLNYLFILNFVGIKLYSILIWCCVDVVRLLVAYI